MDNIFRDETKIKFYGRIQRNLCSLEQDACDNKIDEIINLIPHEFLFQKEDLLIICQLFAIYAKSKFNSHKYNALRLFQKIMKYLKKYLQDESSFFWNIFDCLFDFKLIMYRENLLTIEQIIQSSMSKSPLGLEYFLPEIIEREPELFDKEIKHKLTISYSKESIEKFKEIREKHFNWLLNFKGDFHSQIYKEIEQDKLRLSLKTDDIDTFQQIVSNTNLSINSKIIENIHDKFLNEKIELPLILYSIAYNSINIFKFLLMKDVDIPLSAVYFAINNGNYEIIHLLESKLNDAFKFDSLRSSINSWNFEMTEYVLNNFDTYDFLQKSDMEFDINSNLLILLNNINFNFVFFESILLPFLRRNPKLVENSIHLIIHTTFGDMTSFFTKEFSKHPNFDINHFSKEFKCSPVSQAIMVNNSNAVEFLLNNFDMQHSNLYDLLNDACSNFSDIKIIKLLISEILDVDSDFVTKWIPLKISLSNGNIYATKIILDEIPNFETYKSKFYNFFFILLKNKHLYLLKIILKFFLEKINHESCESVVFKLRNFYSNFEGYKEELLNDFSLIYKEIINT